MIKIRYTLIVLMLLMLSACQAVSPSILTIAPQVQSSAGEPDTSEAPSIYQATLQEADPVTPEISTEELRQLLADESVILFDARPFMEYAVSHIPEALNVAPKPAMAKSEYTSDVAEIGRLVEDNLDQAIVLYCNGPFCGKSKRLSEDLLAAGYTNVRRYQLGAPVWRALGGLMEIEPAGIHYVFANDHTAVFIDARNAEAFAAGSLPDARNIPLDQVAAAKDDGRLPMEDHNTRIVVFGTDEAEAREVAQEIIKNAFHNVTYFAGDYTSMEAATTGNE